MCPLNRFSGVQHSITDWDTILQEPWEHDTKCKEQGQDSQHKGQAELEQTEKDVVRGWAVGTAGLWSLQEYHDEGQPEGVIGKNIVLGSRDSK